MMKITNLRTLLVTATLATSMSGFAKSRSCDGTIQLRFQNPVTSEISKIEINYLSSKGFGDTFNAARRNARSQILECYQRHWSHRWNYVDSFNVNSLPYSCVHPSNHISHYTSNDVDIKANIEEAVYENILVNLPNQHRINNGAFVKVFAKSRGGNKHCNGSRELSSGAGYFVSADWF